MKIVFVFVVVLVAMAAALTTAGDGAGDGDPACFARCNDTNQPVCGKKGRITIEYPNICYLNCDHAMFFHSGRCL